MSRWTKFKRKSHYKWLKVTYLTSLHLLALFALFMIAVALASKFKLTNTSGNIDVNNRYFEQMAGKYNQGFKLDSLELAKQERTMYQTLGIVAKRYPYNAKQILDAYERTGDLTVAQRMLDATNLVLSKDKDYQKEIKEISNQKNENVVSLYPWANYKEWKDFCKYVKADKKAIDSVAKITGVEARLIVTCLVGEQIRMFNSFREKFKNQVYQYNHIILPRNIGYGVTGILEKTALRIESTLFEPNNPFFPGEYYQQCIDFGDSLSSLPETDTITAHKYPTIQRLIRGGNHFYSYLYTALFLRQFQSQWEKQGFTLAYRPEILATLFNLGYQKSKPSKNPSVGGSEFKVGDKDYTFGGLCYEFYYSGELQELFPLTSRPFIPTAELERTIKFTKVKKETIEEAMPVEGGGLMNFSDSAK